MNKQITHESRRKVNKTLFEVEGLKLAYQQCSVEADQAEAIVEKNKDTLTQIIQKFENVQNKLLSAQADIDACPLPEGAQPKSRIQLRDQLQLESKQLEAEISAQKSVVANSMETHLNSERLLFEADREINRFAFTLDDATQSAIIIKEFDKQKEKRQRKLDELRKNRIEKQEKAYLLTKEKEKKELLLTKQHQDDVAKQQHVIARKHLNELIKTQKETEEKVRQETENHFTKRTDVVLNLKSNINQINLEVSQSAEKYNKKKELNKKKFENEKDELLAKGLNPYIEFRKKEFNDADELKEQTLHNIIEKNKKELTERLKKEEIFLKKQHMVKQIEYEYEKKHRESQGRHVIEKKNENYLKKKTIEHVEILDATGKLERIYPSTMAQFNLDLRKANLEVAKNIRKSLLQNEEEIELLNEFKQLLPSKSKDSITIQESDEHHQTCDEMIPQIPKTQIREFETLANPNGLIPGLDPAATMINFENNNSEKAKLLTIAVQQDGVAQAQSMIDQAKSPKYEFKTLSKFESDSLERAKERHQTRIDYGTEQIAGGKLFRGDAFVAKPHELIYKDFEVGKKYKKTFLLTNVSYTFNSFNIVDLDDSIKNFFVITYEKPGRMSAGFSCPLEIVFTPKLNHYIYTHIKLLTETGPVEIPLKCLIKRCAPSIVNPTIDFNEVVIGQISYDQIKITNSQALPTKFRVFAAEEAFDTFDLVTQEDQLQVDPAEGQNKPEGSEQPEDATNELGNDNNINTQMNDMNGNAEDERIGMNPAVSEIELETRIKRVLSEVYRKKKLQYPHPLRVDISEGYLDGYSSAVIGITCAPLTAGSFERAFRVVFENIPELDDDPSVNEQGKTVLREQTFTTKVQGVELPVYVQADHEVIDLKSTFINRIYRCKVNIKNRGKSAFKVLSKVRKHFKNYVEVTPNLAFVQSKGFQTLNVRFTPTLDMLKELIHFTVPLEGYEGSALMMLPIELQVVNQELPVYFVLKCIVTSSLLEFSPNHLHFGKLFVNQSSSMNVSIRNTSVLPQKLAFVRLKKEISVQPNDGFGVLLPNESQDFTITFSPQTAMNYDTDLVVMTSSNDKYTIKMNAEGVESPLEFTVTVMHLRTTAPGERVLASTEITNKTSFQQCFEAIIPDKRCTWINISPTAVNLAPKQTCRLEIEFNPPANLLDLDPDDWYESLKTAEDGQDSQIKRFFDDWMYEYGWSFGKSVFGELQWVKYMSRLNESVSKEPSVELEAPTPNAETPAIQPESQLKELNLTTVEEGSFISTQDSQQKDVPEVENLDLPIDEWGIVGKWNIPILLKPRKRNPMAAINAASTIMADDLLHSSSTASRQQQGSLNKSLSDHHPQHHIQSPLFLTIHTAITLPQLEVDVKLLDFGQISVGTRYLKSFKIFNRGMETIQLKAIGLNVFGPFNLIRPVKHIAGGESRVIVVECLPRQAGLIVEVIEISNANDLIGGHRLNVTLKVQGLQPSVELQGLQSPPSNWTSRGGLLDFGHCLPNDFITKSFVIQNKSSFAVDAKIVRIAGKGLSLTKQSDMMEKTLTGLPIFTIRPERVQIEQGKSQEIEVIFRPDRNRAFPFREDVEVQIGQTDEILPVGIMGRVWNRQIYVTPTDPQDEPFFHPVVKPFARMEDVLTTVVTVASNTNELRNTVLEGRNGLQLEYPMLSEILLEYPDPFSATADPSSYVVIDLSAPVAATSKGAKAVAAPVVTNTATNEQSVARQQVRKLSIGIAKAYDNRSNSGGSGTFEILLGSEAKDSGLWSVTNEKGTITPNVEVTVEILCTMKKPRSLGGLFIGSWKYFEAVVVMKGGWVPPGESDEVKIPIILKAYVNV